MRVFFLLVIFSMGALGAPALKKIPASEPSAEKPAKDHGKNVAKSLRADLKDGRLIPLSKHTDRALDMIVSRGLAEMRKAGRSNEADLWEAQWAFHYYGYLTKMVVTRDIGDHAPLIQWLAVFYERLEFVLGVEACKAFHLSDLKTFNFAIPIVFHPGTFVMEGVPGTRRDEYRRHFAAGEVYYGLIPVVTYWLIDVPCMAGTAGLAALLCGPAASVGEYVMGKFIAPRLSDRVFDRFNKP